MFGFWKKKLPELTERELVEGRLEVELAHESAQADMRSCLATVFEQFQDHEGNISAPLLLGLLSNTIVLDCISDPAPRAESLFRACWMVQFVKVGVDFCELPFEKLSVLGVMLDWADLGNWPKFYEIYGSMIEGLSHLGSEKRGRLMGSFFFKDAPPSYFHEWEKSVNRNAV